MVGVSGEPIEMGLFTPGSEWIHVGVSEKAKKVIDRIGGRELLNSPDGTEFVIDGVRYSLRRGNGGVKAPKKSGVVKWFQRFVVAILLFGGGAAQAIEPVPDGTMIMSRLRGGFGNWLSQRCGTHWTHVAIVFDQMVYEGDWPRSKSTPLRYYGKRNWEIQIVKPSRNLTVHEKHGMKSWCMQNMNRRYGLKQFWNPRAKPDGRIYCSQFVYLALNAGGLQLPAGAWHTPDKILAAARKAM